MNVVIIILVQSKLIVVEPRSRISRKCSYIGNCHCREYCFQVFYLKKALCKSARFVLLNLGNRQVAESPLDRRYVT